jgi:hypothetical protein
VSIHILRQSIQWWRAPSLWDSDLIYTASYPTLKRGANKLCACGAGQLATELIRHSTSAKQKLCHPERSIAESMNLRLLNCGFYNAIVQDQQRRLQR